MRFTVVTILPELIEPALAAGVVGRAREAGVIRVDTVNPRDFTHDRHRTVDDTPYGGGPGMVMKAEPLLAAIERATHLPKVVDDTADLDVPTSVDRPLKPVTVPPTDEEIARLEREVAAEPKPAAGDETDAALADLEAEALRATPLKIVDAETKPIRYGAGEAAAQAAIDRAVAVADATTENIEHMLSPAPAPTSHGHRILLSPSGKPLTQARVRELAKLDHLVLVCGRYEGVDQRVIDMAIDEELSIGDYVLSGGELGALVIIDAVARLVPGVLGEPTSADDESFTAGLLEYPQYTRPQELAGRAVPTVLQSGNHAVIAAWRREQAMRRTAARRPDLWKQFRPTKADAKLLPPLRARTHLALVHHPVRDRTGAVITTALTNFDIHDLARSSMTYGLAGYHIVTPITSQREKAEHIAKSWIEDEGGEHRAQALQLVRTAASIEAVIEALTAEHGRRPVVVATSAKTDAFASAARRTSSELLAEASLEPAPLLLLLGTGWGLVDTMIPSVSRVLAPIEGDSDWNHLAVRSAGAVILDRLFGRPA